MTALVFFLNIVLNLVLIFVMILLAGAAVYIGMYLGERITCCLIRKRERRYEKLHDPSWKNVQFAKDSV